MSLVVTFPGAERTSVEELGGKGASLVRMAAAGLPVPAGAVLTADFFAPWFGELQETAAWTALVRSEPEAWSVGCSELRRIAMELGSSAGQRYALDELRRGLLALGAGALFAVRSSSPEEDLATASFAGVYETRLGVRATELEAAIRSCFCSALDERVLVYKRARGFDVFAPRLAVVVQRQIASEAAGVAFSLNPLTNDYDEAVVDANWGLGESVVAGLASPDHFVVDKLSGQIVDKKLGAKQLSIWLETDGGTVRRHAHRSSEPSLGDEQVVELARLVVRVERLYEQPTDIEWAWAEGGLCLLQARPITSWVPLPPEMLTTPGERRRLYADSALSQGLVINQPISQLGLSWLHGIFYVGLLRGFLGIDDFTPGGGMLFTAGSRLYLNISNLMWLGMTPKRMAAQNASFDSLLADTLATVDPERYRASRRPSWFRLRLLMALPKGLWALRGAFMFALRVLLTPESARRSLAARVEELQAELADGLDYGLPLEQFARRYTARLGRELPRTLVALFAGLVSPDFLVRRRSDELRALAARLRRGLEGNIVVEQGLALYRLARLLEPGEFADLGALAQRIEKRTLSAEFLSEWDDFQHRFGCRGPHEMDLSSPRYGDDPTLALEQMSYMVASEHGFDPAAAHRRNLESRRRAYAELLGRLGWFRRVLLRRIHRMIGLYGGTRDTPKHLVVALTFAIRKRALLEGRRLVEQGRLDDAQQIFDLTFGDLDLAGRDPSLDLRALCAQRTRFETRLAAQVAAFPQLIDSRGRIPRPPARETVPGELAGMPVSPGVVTGPVKVLRSPREKPVSEGDVLVAYTTDPGWTPLFVNAAAVVLEVGGVLQHGAVVAREYGKPCVAGIDRVLSRLRDGQRVEVDGTAGVVRLVATTGESGRSAE
jgi:pyruvate,water dikinase